MLFKASAMSIQIFISGKPLFKDSFILKYYIICLINLLNTLQSLLLNKLV
jgi:hypothetical protein